MLGNDNHSIYLKISKASWIKRSAIIVGCDNTSDVIHEVVAVHYDPSRNLIIARTSGTKEWTVDQEEATVSATVLANSNLLIMHTGFSEVGYL